MSRTATVTQMPQPTTTPPVPRERIALRAYEKWLRKGRPAGTDVQDWMEAEAELKAELCATDSKTAATTTGRQTSTSWASPTGQRY